LLKNDSPAETQGRRGNQKSKQKKHVDFILKKISPSQQIMLFF